MIPIKAVNATFRILLLSQRSRKTKAEGLMPNEDKLPSNKKFGLFWWFVFLLFSGLSHFNGTEIAALVFLAVSIAFLLLSVSKPIVLRPLNIAWMKLGFVLGKILSPLIMILIFLMIFCPLGILFKMFRRDELGIAGSSTTSNWKKPSEDEITKEHFLKQF